MIKIIQIVKLEYSSGLLEPQTNSTTSKTSHTKPKKIIGASKNFSTEVRSFFLSLISWSFMAWNVPTVKKENLFQTACFNVTGFAELAAKV